MACGYRRPSVEPFLANTNGWIAAVQSYTTALEEVVEGGALLCGWESRALVCLENVD
jgi:hypothetical protein